MEVMAEKVYGAPTLKPQDVAGATTGNTKSDVAWHEAKRLSRRSSWKADFLASSYIVSFRGGLISRVFGVRGVYADPT